MYKNTTKMEKLNLAFISIFIVLSLFSSVMVAGAAAGETISIGSAIVESGDTFVLPITIANSTDVEGVSLNVTYNQSIVTILSVLANSSISDSAVTSNIDNITGVTTIAVTNTNYINTTSATPLVDITFKAVSSGISALNLQDVYLAKEYAPYPPGTVNNGSILVNDTTPSHSDISWNATISATNQLEPVVVGMHPDASDGYDSFDEFSLSPVQDKVTMSLDGTYAKSVKMSVSPKSNVTWDLLIGVPQGQSTTLTWDMKLYPQIVLHIYNGTDELSPGTELGEGSSSLLVVAEVVEKIDFTLPLKAGWNMVSIPLIPDDSSVSVIFKDISTLSIRPVVTWENPLFVQVDQIEPKIGYWVFTPQNIDIIVTGMPIVDTNLSLKAGWNMVGTTGFDNFDLTFIPNQVSQRPPVTWENPLFVSINELVAGKASWVFVTQNTEVVI